MAHKLTPRDKITSPNMSSTIHTQHDTLCQGNGCARTAIGLLKLGCETLSRGKDDDALTLFDTAHSILTGPSNVHIWSLAAKQLECCGEGGLCVNAESVTASCASVHHRSLPADCPPDLFQEDECDVGPRALRNPISPAAADMQNWGLLEAIVLFNKGLVYYSKGLIHRAKQVFEIVSYSGQTILNRNMAGASTSCIELVLRSFNNLGLLHYLERKENMASKCFETAADASKMISCYTKAYRVEYATIVSNWCRSKWMRGDTSDRLYEGLREVLAIRSNTLSWDHPDVAASLYNIAVVGYARQDRDTAISSLLQYLAISSHRSKKQLEDLDSVPALILLLLIKNEDKNNNLSQELVRGLRTLLEKRQGEGPESSEVASVLNFVGTILFHQQDFENALVFFQEELRLEEKMSTLSTVQVDGTTPLSVTCNNIGRIYQELGRNEDAKRFYERCLKARYGDDMEMDGLPIEEESPLATSDTLKTGVAPMKLNEEDLSSSVNLYSTVWYNLGLIEDKLGFSDEAIRAFEMSLHLRKALLGYDHPDVACLMYNIGVLHMEQKRLNDASDTFMEAVRIRRIGGPGQLSDLHVVKTLEKLTVLHRAKGSINRALEASQAILSVQETSSELDNVGRMKVWGSTLRTVAELHHEKGETTLAIGTALDSVRKLRTAAKEAGSCYSHFVHKETQEILVLDHVASVEQLVSSQLLLGSLYQEIGEPILASELMLEATGIVEETRASASQVGATLVPTSLIALFEVTSMLAKGPCAPKA